jgi:Pentapeptide repeats (9 copies)
MTQEVSEYSPKLYRDAKLDRILEGASHQHSRFTDVNGKDALFEGLDFSYCLFTRAYFHNTTFANCRFVGAHFIDCNFRNSTLRDCDFSYSNFNGTRIPTREILKNLPPWPNVRRELLQILRRNATSVGDYTSERIFVIREIDSEKEHYRRAWRRDEPYYQRKYDPKLKWLLAGLRLMALKIDSLFGGTGSGSGRL